MARAAVRLGRSHAARVLDVGCGTGFLALRFAEMGHDVTGVDLAPHMIERARRKAEEDSLEVDFRTGDAVDLDLPAEMFDLVTARHVIWNLPDPERGVAEWLRVIRPGGRLALVEGKWAENDTLYLSHRQRVESRLKDWASLVIRSKRAGREYARLELPFSGGPSATRLARFLEDHSVQDVALESLMDPALWGEPVEFPRYLAIGTRAGGD